MKAIILSAGKKNEISNLFGEIPKSLIPIEDEYILEIQLNILHACGIDDISIVRGYKAELITIPGIKYYDNKEYDIKNILHSLFCAEEEFDDDIVVIYGDVILNRECLERILRNKNDISIGVAVKLEDYKKKYIEKLELVYFDSDNNVTRIGKKLNCENEAYGQFSGIIKFTNKGINSLKLNYNTYKVHNEKWNQALITDLLSHMAEIGISINCTVIERGWVKISSEDDYNKLINDSHFVNDILKTKTDWALRSKTYDNIQWVNANETLETMLELSELNKKDAKIIDIGVGTGKVLKFFKNEYPDLECYGIDISSDMMEKIEKEYKFKLSIANAEDLSEFQEEFFDLVTARMSMHHVNNLDKAMNEVYKILKEDGSFVICEGVSPDKDTLEFYEEVFRYKETRNSFLVDDLINHMTRAGFDKVTTRTIIVKDMSMNNWLDNAGIPFRNKDIISKLHYNCSEKIKKAYNMKFTGDDILMEWKFVVVSGKK